MTGNSPALRARAEALAGTFPPLLADAEQLASTVMFGEHGRRRAGAGDEFWQYRPASAGDPAAGIDWRRSARSDAHFVREKEWQAAQAVSLWVDNARSMEFRGDSNRPAKLDRARLVALALCVLLVRAGERVGLTGQDLPPRSGVVQLERMAVALTHGSAQDYGSPDVSGLLPRSRAVFLSDFLGDPEPLEAALVRAADTGVKGALVQVLDPVEETFPFDGRTVFQSMGGGLRHETFRASDLRTRYLDRLAERRDRLDRLARMAGWSFFCHHTDAPALTALTSIHHAIERRR